MSIPHPPIAELNPQGLKTLELMQSQKMRIRALNIVYFEGINPDLKTINNDRLDHWNDVRAIVTDDGDVLMAALATTEPGLYYTRNRMNSKGAFRIKLGEQFRDAWAFGKHYEQEALVQCGAVTGYRDHNEDGKRTGDATDTGTDFYINQHTTNGLTDFVGRWSAGCLVGAHPVTHYRFLRILRDSGMRKFDTVVFDGAVLLDP